MITKYRYTYYVFIMHVFINFTYVHKLKCTITLCSLTSTLQWAHSYFIPTIFSKDGGQGEAVALLNLIYILFF